MTDHESSPDTHAREAAPGDLPSGDADHPVPGAMGAAPSSADALRERIIDTLKTCYDPEIPVDIYELGLVYSVEVEPSGSVAIKMTLTSPMCPVAGSLPPEVETKVREVPGVTEARVDVVWDPPWEPRMMSEVARLKLNMF